MKKSFESNKAPKPIGPYSQAIGIGDLVFCSGQVGTDPKTGNLKEGVEAQTRQAFSNIRAVLETAGSDMSNVLKMNVYLKNVSDFAAMNKIYETQFKKPYPARATVGVAELPKGALIEIECVAYKHSRHHDEHEEGGCCGEC